LLHQNLGALPELFNQQFRLTPTVAAAVLLVVGLTSEMVGVALGTVVSRVVMAMQPLHLVLLHLEHG
jgi:hypothetical protein